MLGSRGWAALRRTPAYAAVALVATPASTALAHTGAPPAPADLWTAWSWDPAVLLGLVAAAAVYARGVRTFWARVGTGRGVARWQAAAYAGGLAALFIALVSPLDALSSALFAAHMVQHLLLILAAAPLLVLGSPVVPFLWAFRRARRRAIGRWWRRASAVRAGWHALSQPAVVWVLYTATLWIWHLPGLYQAALASEPIHALEHLALLATALLFWWTVLHPGRHGRLGYGPGVLYVFAATVQSALLGILMTFARAPWYPAYAASTEAWGLTPLEDQQLAGLLMWVPAGLVYLVAASALFVAWLQIAERETQRREHAAEV